MNPREKFMEMIQKKKMAAGGKAMPKDKAPAAPPAKGKAPAFPPKKGAC